MRRLAGPLLTLAVGFLAGAPLAGAQEWPLSSYAEHPIEFEVTRAFAFDGCAPPMGVYRPQTGLEYGVPYCLRGTYLTGIGRAPGTDDWAILGGFRDVRSYNLDPRLAGPPWMHPLFSIVWVTGRGYGGACPPGGCAPPGWSGSTLANHVVTYDLGSAFVPETFLATPLVWVPTYDPFRGRPNAGYMFTLETNAPITLSLTAVPEPSTYGLFATGLLGLAGVARRKRKA